MSALASVLAAAAVMAVLFIGSRLRVQVSWRSSSSPIPSVDPGSRSSEPKVGRVTLVGSGPGSADMLTSRAVAVLAEADVVLVDRLAVRDELVRLAPSAVIIDVGKRPGCHPVPQEEINRLLVQHAASGSRVVRLKGGDPYVFGRGGEEVIACREAGVPVTVVSGVTSAISVPAAAGIPLTHRNVSHGFTVISGHAPLAEHEFEALATLGGTIVVLMGVLNLPNLTAGLVRHGLAAGTAAAIVERGFTVHQRTTVATLGTLDARVAQLGVRSPAVIVIGDVVNLRGKLDMSGVAGLADHDSSLNEEGPASTGGHSAEAAFAEAQQ